MGEICHEQLCSCCCLSANAGSHFIASSPETGRGDADLGLAAVSRGHGKLHVSIHSSATWPLIFQRTGYHQQGLCLRAGMQVPGSPLGWVSDCFAEHPDAESKDILFTRVIKAGWIQERAPLTNTKVARKANAGITFQLLLISTAKKSIAVLHSEDKD